ncbi:MAG TPA: hypothetical protein VJ436_04520 [Anaerolineales bacterium]|nr:hypothetical protein [Anaerolineales bacterium]
MTVRAKRVQPLKSCPSRQSAGAASLLARQSSGARLGMLPRLLAPLVCWRR